jgi:hypothetical protein
MVKQEQQKGAIKAEEFFKLRLLNYEIIRWL